MRVLGCLGLALLMTSCQILPTCRVMPGMTLMRDPDSSTWTDFRVDQVEARLFCTF